MLEMLADETTANLRNSTCQKSSPQQLPYTKNKNENSWKLSIVALGFAMPAFIMSEPCIMPVPMMPQIRGKKNNGCMELARGKRSS